MQEIENADGAQRKREFSSCGQAVSTEMETVAEATQLWKQ